MLELKSCSLDGETVSATYAVVHNDPGYGTTLTEMLQIQICKNTGAIKGKLNIDDLEAPSMQEGLEKLATWCERLAKALREPMKVKTSVPVFEKDWDAIHCSETGSLGLTFQRLQALASKQGIAPRDTFKAAMNLYENNHISYPKTETAYLPSREKENVAKTLKVVKHYLRNIEHHAEINLGAAIFNDDGVMEHHSIVPRWEENLVEQAPLDEAHFDGISGSATARAVYRIIAEEYVRAVCHTSAR